VAIPPSPSAAPLANGYFPGEGKAERLAELIAAVRQACLDIDRNPDEVEINAMFGRHFRDPAAGIDIMRNLGVGRVMVPAFFFAGDGGLDRLRAFGETHVLPNRS
jgi:hypothetical protein